MDRIRVATIGIGRKGRDHVQSFCAHDKEYEVIAICDNDPERLEVAPDCVKNARRYSSLDEVLKDDDIEMVTITTRHRDHVPMALKILESGRYCGIEKPVATSLREFAQLKEAAARHPGKLFLLHNRRFEPGFVKAKEIIDSGLIGTVNYIKLYRSVGYCRRNDWMTIPEFYGGLLTNWGPHLIDQALRFLDSPVCDLWADLRHCISIGAGDDLFKIVMTAQNGRVADVEVTGANTMPGREMEIIGSYGTIVYDGSARIHVRHLDPTYKLAKLEPHRENPPFQYGNFDETLYFVDADYDIPKTSLSVMWTHIYKSIREGVPYPIKIEEGEEVVRVTEQAIRFAKFAPLMPFVDGTVK